MAAESDQEEAFDSSEMAPTRSGSQTIAKGLAAFMMVAFFFAAAALTVMSMR